MIIKNHLDHVLSYGTEKTAIFTVSYDQTNDRESLLHCFITISYCTAITKYSFGMVKGFFCYS